MRLVPLQMELIVSAGLAAWYQPGLLFDSCYPEGRPMLTDATAGDTWVVGGKHLCGKPWPMTLYALSARILNATFDPRAGRHLKLVYNIDDTRFATLEHGVQSMLSSVRWTGGLPLNWGFGVVMNGQLIATDVISVRALYGVNDATP